MQLTQRGVHIGAQGHRVPVSYTHLTTIKCVVLGEHDELLYSTYERHYSHILEKAQELLRRIDAEHLHGLSLIHISMPRWAS